MGQGGPRCPPPLVPPQVVLLSATMPMDVWVVGDERRDLSGRGWIYRAMGGSVGQGMNLWGRGDPGDPPPLVPPQVVLLSATMPMDVVGDERRDLWGRGWIYGARGGSVGQGGPR